MKSSAALRVPTSGGRASASSRLVSVAAAPARVSRMGVVYAVVSVVSIAAIACAQLVLSIATSETAYRIAELTVQQKELARNAQTVREDLDRVKSPQFLAANAEALGMVRNANPAFMRLSDGAVMGAPTPAAPGAGTVLGASGSQVPNALTHHLPLITNR